MKNEKLELLLNKVVEYNHPDEIYVKGFLYKDHRGHYYLKIVETLLGSLTFSEHHYLKAGDEDFIKQADKPKLMRISLKSWHYRLIKYVMRDNAPTPKTMQNGCPYFWLLMFSILVVPFIVLAKGIWWAFLFIPKMIFWVLEEMVVNWIDGLDDETAYEIQYRGCYGSSSKMPKTAKLYFENSGNDFFDFFLSKKYKNLNPDDPAYSEKRKEIREKWEIWRADLDKKREEARERETIKETKRMQNKVIAQHKARKRKEHWEAKMKPIEEGFANIGAWFKKTFTVERGRVNVIVKRTKQFVGAIVTLLILGLTFLAVNFLALGFMVIIDAIIAGGWIIIVGVIVGLALIGLGYLIYVLVFSWVQTILNKYESGKKVWYVQPFIYLILYPIYYLFMALVFIVVKIIWETIKFIFYTVIFKNFLKPIALFIVKMFVGLWKGIVGSTGVFGEYFGASYSDYCPGIEWCDIDEE